MTWPSEFEGGREGGVWEQPQPTIYTIGKHNPGR